MSPAQALAREIVTRSDPRLGPPHLLYVFGALHRSYPLAAQRDADYLHLLGNAERLLARRARERTEAIYDEFIVPCYHARLHDHMVCHDCIRRAIAAALRYPESREKSGRTEA